MSTAPAALTAVNLEKSFGGLKAVRGVSLECRPGEIHAVIGPNGAGKSTLINLLTGDLHVSGGHILIGGQDVTRYGPDRRGHAGMGRSYQKTTIFPNFTVFENVRLSAQARAARPLRMFAPATSDAAINNTARTALETVGLSDMADTIASRMSHGQQRHLEIGMVLATRPRIILLDEPLAGMGQREARDMIALIARLGEQQALLLVEHDMDAVFSLARRLTVMADGQMIGSGTPEEVRANPHVRAAYLGHED